MSNPSITSSKSRVRSLLPCVLAVAVSCEPGGTHLVRTAFDTSGVQSVTTERVDLGAAVPGWTVVPSPAVVIGNHETDPRYQIGYLRTATRLANGDVVVADANLGLRWYDRSGGHLRDVGRIGEGRANSGRSPSRPAGGATPSWRTTWGSGASRCSDPMELLDG